jgi:hypothetical protein
MFWNITAAWYRSSRLISLECRGEGSNHGLSHACADDAALPVIVDVAEAKAELKLLIPVEFGMREKASRCGKSTVSIDEGAKTRSEKGSTFQPS